MAEHAVFWRDSAAPGAVFGGGVAVERGRLRLRGSDGRSRIVETVPAAELAAVAPGGDTEPIGEYPSLRLDLRGGRSIVLAAVARYGRARRAHRHGPAAPAARIARPGAADPRSRRGTS